MSIEFHCEHCNMVVKAPDDAGGRPGKCPHCQGTNYIPRPDAGEIPLEPLDEGFEQHRKQSAAEDFAYQRRIMSDRTMPGEGGRGARPGGARPTGGSARSERSAGAEPAEVLSDKQISSLIVSFISAMASGSLPKAEEISQRLRPNAAKVNGILDDMLSTENIAGYGLPTLPKPVLNGFVKQLRAKIS
ncbi:MAG: hypothetical protein H6819_12825 [Phycisphaerales bacterium]|nr:hypothetical protein [Phycisphaerales bacterium]MCB9858758.1 hypothetical protein [Phycisphaerales bacterium]